MVSRIVYWHFLRRLAVLASLGMLISGCQLQIPQRPNNKEPLPLMNNERLYATRDTGQIIVEGDNLRIGVGNVWDPSVGGAGQETPQQVTVGLWLFFREKPDVDQTVRLAEGQSVQIEGYLIRVIEINLEDQMIVVGVAPPSDEDASPEN